MTRRRFFKKLAFGAGTALLAGAGGRAAWCGWARGELRARLLDDALPSLAQVGLTELNALPVRAREEMRCYFHGRCLNVEGFVSHVCSRAFTELLGRCASRDEREVCFLQAFCGRVATEAEILNQVWATAADVGTELDAAWDGYCAGLAARWAARIPGASPSGALDDFAARMGEVIRAEISRAVREMTSGHQRPALGEAVGRVGESAVLLLPLMRFGQAGLAVGVPLFVILAARPAWDYLMSRLEDRRGDYQAQISGRLALLGNHVGAEFEREVRRRIVDLHDWRERAVRGLVGKLSRYAKEFTQMALRG